MEHGYLRRQQNAAKKTKRKIDWMAVFALIFYGFFFLLAMVWIGVLIWGVFELVSWITTK